MRYHIITYQKETRTRYQVLWRLCSRSHVQWGRPVHRSGPPSRRFLNNKIRHWSLFLFRRNNRLLPAKLVPASAASDFYRLRSTLNLTSSAYAIVNANATATNHQQSIQSPKELRETHLQFDHLNGSVARSSHRNAIYVIKGLRI